VEPLEPRIAQPGRDRPDPSASNGGMGYNLAGVDTQSPQYQAAQQACRSQQ
jgi:hypothetical protein